MLLERFGNALRTIVYICTSLSWFVLPVLILTSMVVFVWAILAKLAFTANSLGGQVVEQATEVSIVYGGLRLFREMLPHLCPPLVRFVTAWLTPSPLSIAPVDFSASDSSDWGYRTSHPWTIAHRGWHCGGLASRLTTLWWILPGIIGAVGLASFLYWG